MSRKNFRAPSVPLITHDPFFSVWSNADNLTDDATRHWTGKRQAMFGVLVFDEKIYEFMGKVGFNDEYYFTGYNKLPQVSCEVRPMTTIYKFENEDLKMELKFTSPLLLNDLMLLSRPITYISYKVEAKDGKEHSYDIQFGFSGELCVNENSQEVFASVTPLSIYFSSGDENMLKRTGDDHRIEWGEFHVIAPDYYQEIATIRNYQFNLSKKYGSRLFYKNCMNSQGPRRELKGPEMYRVSYDKMRVNEFYPIALVRKEFVTDKPVVDHIAVGYNDFKSIQYFGENIDAYWKKDGDDFNAIMDKSIKEYDAILEKVNDFEEELLENARKISDKYADIISLAYRQAISGHKLTFHNGEVQFLSKENYSNGCIGTVDVTYPSIPLFLIYEPVLVEGMLNPIFDMINKGLWTFEFAPHDVGQYPIANGQVYGYSFLHRKSDCLPIVKQMPVEECGNMILCVAAICAANKNNDYFVSHEAILRQWADYLVKIGYNPDNQLCTDDFAGHLAHNVNLSAKGVCAVGAIAKMYSEIGDTEKAEYYSNKAKSIAKEIEENSLDANGYYRLAFDQEGTWSIKYNMVWDKLFGLNLFSQKLYDAELAQYKAKVQKYGVPLDCRGDYTKTDWEMWSTALFNDKEYTDMIVNSMWDFLCDTPERVPFTDMPFTNAPYMRSFVARTVQGGLFINMLKF